MTEKVCSCLGEDYLAQCYTYRASGCRCPVCESYMQSRKTCPVHGAPVRTPNKGGER